MANKLISEMGLPKSIANVFAARNIITAKDALSLTEFELMELLDVGFQDVTSAIASISQMVCPPFETALSLFEQRQKYEYLAGHLPTTLKGLDKALCGGIPFGVVTELVGPAGIGKTQFCLKLALLASLPACYGGLDGSVVYIDVESKFSSRRMIEIGSKSFPQVFYHEGLAKEMAGRILVLQPASLAEFTDSLQQIKVSVLQNKVKLVVIDSMAALISGEGDLSNRRQHTLGWHISFLKSLAELSRIPIVVTNQVRSQSQDGVSLFSFQHTTVEDMSDTPSSFDSHLIAALGIHWAHAVSIRLILELRSGHRFMKIAKSPISPPLEFQYQITSSGISLLSDNGVEVSGSLINSIHSHDDDDE
ncbi:DNA repair protein RAD51 homolog 2 isoform X2 [Silene latifolia]|uniref:DNA repair protein RAD51 homolog 2 isoform X2 n=1 Tax=Silene latifolia TaxID=37657 RepID=UPI003D7866B4